MAGSQTGNAPFQAPSVTAPQIDTIQVKQVTNAATVHFDLGVNSNQKFMSIISGEKMFYMYSDGATDACDKTATSGSTRCDMLAANERREEYPTGRYLHVIADATTDYVRVRPASP